MSMVIYAASMALDGVKGDDSPLLAGKDIYWWIAGVGVFAAIYMTIGGIQAMIWTDVLQCLLLLAGVLMPIGYVAAQRPHRADRLVADRGHACSRTYVAAIFQRGSIRAEFDPLVHDQ